VGLCRAIVKSLLFGHRRGTSTGAVSDMPGLVIKAAWGTLFLDELCSLGSDVQVKLLRVLEKGYVMAG
jgi:DNA-binding NtrC family response regulator